MKKIIAVITIAILSLSLCVSSYPNTTPVPADLPQKIGNAVRTKQSGNHQDRLVGNITRNSRTKKVIAMYQKEHSDISLQAEYFDWDGYWNKLTTQAATNSLPDIMQMDYSYLKQFAEKNLLFDLTSEVNGIINCMDISKEFLSFGMINKKLYGMALGSNALAILYDPAVIKEAGMDPPSSKWTWMEYEDYITKVYTRTGKQSEPLLYASPIHLLEYVVRQQGESLYSDDGSSLGFTGTGPVQQIFEQMDRLTKKKVYISPYDVPVNAPLEESAFVKGKAFMGAGWSNYAVDTANIVKKPIEMVSLPMGGNQMGLYNKPSMLFSVSSSSSEIDRSISIIDYFINDIEANEILLAERGVPISTKVRTELKNSVNTGTKAAFDYFERINYEDGIVGTAVMPAPIEGLSVNVLMKDLYVQVAFGKLSPEDAAVQFVKQANEILARKQ